jgi:hypothetical protein
LAVVIPSEFNWYSRCGKLEIEYLLVFVACGHIDGISNGVIIRARGFAGIIIHGRRFTLVFVKINGALTYLTSPTYIPQATITRPSTKTVIT